MDSSEPPGSTDLRLGTVGNHKGPLTFLLQLGTGVHKRTTRDSREPQVFSNLPLGTVGNHEGSTDVPLGPEKNHRVHCLTSSYSGEPPGSTDLPLGSVGDHKSPFISRDSRELPGFIDLP